MQFTGSHRLYELVETYDLLSQKSTLFCRVRKQFAKNRLTDIYDFFGRRIIFLREIPIRLRQAPVRTRIRYRATVQTRGELRSLQYSESSS